MPTAKPTLVKPATPAVDLPMHDPVVAAAVEAGKIGHLTHNSVGMEEIYGNTLDFRQDALERFICTTKASSLEGVLAQIEIARGKVGILEGIEQGPDNKLVDDIVRMVEAALDVAASTIEDMTFVSRDAIVGEHYSFADWRPLAVRKKALEEWLPKLQAEGKLDLSKCDNAS